MCTCKRSTSLGKQDLNKNWIWLCFLTVPKNFVSLMDENKFDTAVTTDEDNIYYLTGYYDYLHMDLGSPTL